MNEWVLFFMGVFAGLGQATEGPPCNFKGYATFRASDFIETGVIKKVTPKYPEEARKLGQSGRVYVRILIDEWGYVKKACVDSSLSSTSDRSLTELAEKSAIQWRYRRNFGFPVVPKGFKGKHLEGVIGFNFSPPTHPPPRDPCDKKPVQ